MTPGAAPTPPPSGPGAAAPGAAAGAGAAGAAPPPPPGPRPQKGAAAGAMAAYQRMRAAYARLPPVRSVLFGLAVGYMVASNYMESRAQKRRDAVADRTLLHWRLANGSVVENAAEAKGLAGAVSRALLGESETQVPISLVDVVRALKLAQDDDRITGLACRIVDDGVGPPLKFGQMQELRDAVEEFKAAKKARLGEKAETIVFTETFENQGHYFLASAFDKIVMQPTGSVGLLGMSSAAPFFKRLLDRLGIHLRAEAREEYKSVVATFTEEQFTPPQKENLTALLRDINDQMLESIANSRAALSKAAGEGAFAERLRALRGLVSRGPLSADEAKAGGLVDHLAYRDDVSAYLVLRPAKSLGHYLRVRDRELADARDEKIEALSDAERPKRPLTVGVVYVLDEITRHGNQHAASHVAKALREAANDKNVDAIVIRVNSPGGDVVASDTLLGLTRRIKIATQKPIVASFAGISASGGYYLSASADAIVANPATITGSIGVAALSPYVTPEFLDKLGVTLDEVHLTNATKANSILHDLHADPDALARYRAHVDATYDTFLRVVARGRGMHVDDVRKVAGGRVFSGRAAREYGLVDALGGVYDATQLAARIALHRTPDLLTRDQPSTVAKIAKRLSWKEPRDDAKDSPLHSKPGSLHPPEGDKQEKQEGAAADNKAQDKQQPAPAAAAAHARVDFDALPEIPEHVEVRVQVFPREKGFQELLREQTVAQDYADFFWRGFRSYMLERAAKVFQTHTPTALMTDVPVDGSM